MRRVRVCAAAEWVARDIVQRAAEARDWVELGEVEQILASYLRRLGEAEEAQRAPPHERYRVLLDARGSDWDGAMLTLGDLYHHVREHGPRCQLVSGGGLVHVVDRGELVTRAVYEAERDAWVA